MCIITALATAAAAIGTAVSTAASAVGGALASVGSAIASSAAAQAVANVGFGMIGAVGGSSAIAAAPTWLGVGLGAATIAGGVAAVGMAGYGIIKSARASSAAQKAQEEAIKKLQENQGQPEVGRVTSSLQENSRINRTLSSLRISMLPQKQDKEEIIKNVYGVDSNLVATSTQNMTGLNIAA